MTIPPFTQPVVKPIAKMTVRFETGEEKIIGAIDNGRSIIKMSAETKVTSLPELVEVIAFTERLPSLSYIALTRIFLTLTAIMIPY